MSPITVTTTLPLWADLLASLALVAAAVFCLVGAWGLAKLGDFFKRLHGPSKATTLGTGCALAASALVFACAGRASLHELLIVAFLFLTAPVSAQLLIQVALKAHPALRPGAPPAAETESPPPAESTKPAPPG